MPNNQKSTRITEPLPVQLGSTLQIGKYNYRYFLLSILGNIIKYFENFISFLKVSTGNKIPYFGCEGGVDIVVSHKYLELLFSLATIKANISKLQNCLLWRIFINIFPLTTPEHVFDPYSDEHLKCFDPTRGLQAMENL